jgi:antitoxin HicB
MAKASARTITKRTETVRRGTYQYTVIFEPAEEGGYVVHIPTLGIATQGEDLNDARAMAEECIIGYLESLRKHGEEIPIEHGEPVTTRLTVSLARV